MGPAQPTYFLSRWLFLRGLALVFAVAFVSLWVQVHGLVGSRGILPIAELLKRIREFDGRSHVLEMPTLCWWSATDLSLHLQCAAGVLLSVALLAGLAPRLCLAVLWALYLSLVTAGQDFLSFQWDVLLLETAVFAIPFAPGSWLPGLSREKPPSPAALFLVRWLLFRLMFASGATKLAYGDPSWRDGTALTFHYWTQPLPTVFAWWMHPLPLWLHRASCTVMYGIEMGLPFLAFLPRLFPTGAFVGLVLLQVLIAVTGNYGFFNMLSLVLCLPLLDDALLARILPGRLGRGTPRERGPIAGRAVAWTLAALVVLQTSFMLAANVKAIDEAPRAVAGIERAVAPFRSLNDYGLFRVMTKERREIEIQGSDDGIAWTPYAFRWKPGDPGRAPGWVQPHMPRLDWQMWFAAFGPPQASRWFHPLLGRLLEGSEPVLGLLADDPFAGRPPRYVRAILYDYRFTTPAEKTAGLGWWHRERLGLYVRSTSLR